MHWLAEFKHDVVCKVSQEVDSSCTAVEETDAHINRAYLLGDISDLEFDDVDVESYATYIKGNEHKKWSADKFGEIVEATLYATLQPNSITTFIVGSKNIDF